MSHRDTCTNCGKTGTFAVKLLFDIYGRVDFDPDHTYYFCGWPCLTRWANAKSGVY